MFSPLFYLLARGVLRSDTKNVLSKVINICSGRKKHPVLHRKRCRIFKSNSFTREPSDCSDASHQPVRLLPSGCVLRLQQAATNRFKHTFSPSVISLSCCREMYLYADDLTQCYLCILHYGVSAVFKYPVFYVAQANI